jgi:uncharacterized protein YegP (UPF0339 family)
MVGMRERYTMQSRGERKRYVQVTKMNSLAAAAHNEERGTESSALRRKMSHQWEKCDNVGFTQAPMPITNKWLSRWKIKLGQYCACCVMINNKRREINLEREIGGNLRSSVRSCLTFLVPKVLVPTYLTWRESAVFVSVKKSPPHGAKRTHWHRNGESMFETHLYLSIHRVITAIDSSVQFNCQETSIYESPVILGYMYTWISPFSFSA